MPPPFELTTTFTWFRPAGVRLIGGLFAITPLSWVALVLAHAPAPLFHGLWVLLALDLVTAAVVLWPRDGTVRVDEGGVTLGEHRIARDAIHSGYFEPATGGSKAHVTLWNARRFPLATIRADAEVGARILSELGLAADQRAATFAVPSLHRTLETLLFWASMAGSGLAVLLLGGSFLWVCLGVLAPNAPTTCGAIKTGFRRLSQHRLGVR